jgi:hypothetical protein
MVGVAGAKTMTIEFALYTRSDGQARFTREPLADDTVSTRAVLTYKYGPRTFLLPDLATATDYKARMIFSWTANAGDALLVWTVQQITTSVRPLDAVGRLGGDEFAVVLPGTDRDEAVDVARRIEAALAPRTSASTGVATYPLDGATTAELHADADVRLYAAKRGTEPAFN